MQISKSIINIVKLEYLKLNLGILGNSTSILSDISIKSISEALSCQS